MKHLPGIALLFTTLSPSHPELRRASGRRTVCTPNPACRPLSDRRGSLQWRRHSDRCAANAYCSYRLMFGDRCGALCLQSASNVNG